MKRSEIESHNIHRIFTITEILDSKARAALAGRMFAEFVLSDDHWDWFRHQLSSEEMERLRQFVVR